MLLGTAENTALGSKWSYASQHHVPLANIHPKRLLFTLRSIMCPLQTLIKKPVRPVCLAPKRLGIVESTALGSKWSYALQHHVSLASMQFQSKKTVETR